MQVPQPTENKDLQQTLQMLRWLLIIAFVVLGWFVLGYLAGVLAPILASLGIAYLLQPLLDWLVKRGMGRGLGAGLLLVVFIGGAVLSISIATPYVFGQLDDFIEKLSDMLGNVSHWLNSSFGIVIPDDWQKYADSKELKDMMTHGGPIQKLGEAVFSGIFGILGVLAEVLLVPVFSFYFLVDWPNLLKRIEHMIPPRKRSQVRDLAKEIDRVIANWVRGQAIVTTILAILYALGFTIIGLPLSIPIGFVVGALTIIPFVGTFVGAGLTLLIVVGGGGGSKMLGGVAVVFVVLHLLEAGVLTPKIVGHRVGLSESGALLAVVAGGKLLGFVGVVLAVPLAATLAVLARYAVKYYERTHFFGHESDADIVVTPAMALIMPGARFQPAVWEAGENIMEDQTELALEGDKPEPTKSELKTTEPETPEPPKPEPERAP